MEVTEDGFGAMARVLLRIARDHAQDRCAAILEGGYDLEGLQQSVLRVLDEMSGDKLLQPLTQLEPRGLLPRVRDVQRRHWELSKD
jgi:acetoin utilization deacetylase AcuC-like enzyme